MDGNLEAVAAKNRRFKNKRLKVIKKVEKFRKMKKEMKLKNQEELSKR